MQDNQSGVGFVVEKSAGRTESCDTNAPDTGCRPLLNKSSLLQRSRSQHIVLPLGGLPLHASARPRIRCSANKPQVRHQTMLPSIARSWRHSADPAGSEESLASTRAQIRIRTEPGHTAFKKHLMLSFVLALCRQTRQHNPPSCAKGRCFSPFPSVGREKVGGIATAPLALEEMREAEMG